jgi:hypothetical protein
MKKEWTTPEIKELNLEETNSGPHGVITENVTYSS